MEHGNIKSTASICPGEETRDENMRCAILTPVTHITSDLEAETSWLSPAQAKKWETSSVRAFRV
jgi:hypothetical protein